MNINDKIAKNLEKLIENSGKNLNTICKEAEVKQPAAYKFLERMQDKITVEDLVKFATYFHVPIEWFYDKNNMVLPQTKTNNILTPLFQWIEETFDNEEEQSWFNVEMKKKFPEYKEWLSAKKLDEKRDQKRIDIA